MRVCQILQICRRKCALISEFLRTNTAARLFTRPARPCSLWREKAFDVVLEGQWISGIFDRVVIYRNEAGQARGPPFMTLKRMSMPLRKTTACK